MISKRFSRSSAPMERVKEFAINTSKGVDCGGAPTSTDTVERMVNLVINPDGSLSPRKFIKQTAEYRDTKFVKRLYRPNCLLKLEANVIVICENDARVKFTLRYRDAYGKVQNIENVEGIPAEELKFESNTFEHGVQVINLTTSSIVGNVSIALDHWLATKLSSPAPHLRKDMYDNDVAAQTSYVSRYFKIYNTAGQWYVEVMSPELNKVSFAEGELALDPNTTLDNPYAIRDTYSAAVPSVAGILAYVHSESTETGIIPTPTAVLDSTHDFQYEYTHPFKCVRALSKHSEISGPDLLDLNKLYAAYAHADMHATCAITDTLDLILTARLSTPSAPADLTHASVVRSMVPPKFNVYAYVNSKDPNQVVDSVHITNVALLSGSYSEIPSTYSSELPASLNIAIDTTGSTPQYTVTKSTKFSSKKFPYAYKYTYQPDSSSCTVTFEAENVLLDEFTDLGVFHKTDNFIRVDVSVSVTDFTLVWEPPNNIALLTESVKKMSYRPVYSIVQNTPAVLKAFCSFGNSIPAQPSSQDSAHTSAGFYASWTKSYDGVDWVDCTLGYSDAVNVRDATYKLNTSASLESETPKYDVSYDTRRFAKINAVSELDSIGAHSLMLRPDVLFTNDTSAQYRFRICSLKLIDSDDTELYEDSFKDNPHYRVDVEYGTALYTFPVSQETKFAEYTYGNTVLGNKLLHKKAIYSYGAEKFNNNIFSTGIDNLITPLYNIIDVDASEDTQVTVLLPWRDYLLSATDRAMYLHSKTDAGYTTKTVSTSLGIPKEFSRCCKQTLNGIVFTSGCKVYFAYPNLYSGSDANINLTDISSKIEDQLSECVVPDGYTRFAFTTSSEYILMVPDISGSTPCTTCFRYNFNDKSWTVCKYPQLFYNYVELSFDDIRLYSCVDDVTREFKLDCDDAEPGLYGDVIGDGILPIEFEWDSGQKTNSISEPKQFVESKLVFSTGDALETFPMQLYVAVDGDPHVTVKDVNTASPFWNSNDLETKGTLGTSVRLTNGGTFRSDKGVLRQLIVRYSGKGKSVRHILTGTTHSKFNFYEAYVRYKTLNIKH